MPTRPERPILKTQKAPSCPPRIPCGIYKWKPTPHGPESWGVVGTPSLKDRRSQPPSPSTEDLVVPSQGSRRGVWLCLVAHQGGTSGLQRGSASRVKVKTSEQVAWHPPLQAVCAFRSLGAGGRLAGLPPALTAPPLSPACSPGINRSTSPNPASPLLPEACWRGTAPSLKGPQQKGSLGRKRGDRKETAVTHGCPGASSLPPPHTRLCRGSPQPRRQPKEPAGTFCPRPACSRVTVDPAPRPARRTLHLDVWPQPRLAWAAPGGVAF